MALYKSIYLLTYLHDTCVSVCWTLVLHYLFNLNKNISPSPVTVGNAAIKHLETLEQALWCTTATRGQQ